MSVYSRAVIAGPYRPHNDDPTGPSTEPPRFPHPAFRTVDTVKIDEDGLIAPLSDISTKELGRVGEDVAASFLEAEGYEILSRNWRCPRGEIDLVARDPEGTTALVEVKTRRAGRGRDCEPEVSVTKKKRERYGVLAKLYIRENGACYPLRCDVVSVTVGNNAWARVRLTPGAFAFDAA